MAGSKVTLFTDKPVYIHRDKTGFPIPIYRGMRTKDLKYVMQQIEYCKRKNLPYLTDFETFKNVSLEKSRVNALSNNKEVL